MDRLETIRAAAMVINSGGAVIIPTETVYGLAADAFNAHAVRRLYEIKNRPAEKRISLIVAEAAQFSGVARDVPDDAYRLAEAFMPGPLTLILNAKANADAGGSSTIGVRIPDHAAALELLKSIGRPLACTSANRSAQPSPVTFAEAVSNVGAECGAAIDGGDCKVKLDSTVRDMTREPYTILRSGSVTKRAIESLLGKPVLGRSIFGLTGVTGAGKSTALKALKSLGFDIIDCDAVYRELCVTSNEMLSELAERFPGTVTCGAINRKELSRIVFGDKNKLSALNHITHKYVRREVLHRISSSSSNIAIEAIGLPDGDLKLLCDYIFALSAPRELRIARISARDGLTRDQAAARVDAQRDDAYFASNADFVIEGDFESPVDFEKYCMEIFRKYTGGHINV